MNNSKLIGSTLIIAGTTIGAGMLALPLASAGLGFSTSLVLMLAIWSLMAFTALLMLELHQHAQHDATLHTLAQQFLGTKGKWLATAAMLFLFYALCAAYIAGGGSQFNQKLHSWFDLDTSQEVATTIFTLLIAAVVTFGTHSVDKVNRLLFGAKIIAMALVLFFLSPSVRLDNLVSMPVQQGLIISALPVIFTSFGFHGSIPAVVKYLELDVKAVKRALVVGSSIPLVVYILWQVSTLGVLSQAELATSSNLSLFINSLSETVHQGAFSNAVSIFADLALLTSFLGVSLGLFEFLADSLSKKSASINRFGVAVVTFTPPLGFALFYPQGFITALGYAAIALVILAVFLPVAMVDKARKQLAYDECYQVRGGNVTLVMATLFGIMIIVTQIAISLGILPALG